MMGHLPPFHRSASAALLVLCACLFSACTSTEGSADAEQVARINTQRADLYITATVQSARLQTTLDYVGTRSSAAATQSQLLKATLVAQGTPIDVLEAFQREFDGSRPTPNSAATSSVASATPDRLLVTPLALPSPTFASGARLEDITMAESVGADDCAVGRTATFSVQSPAIYVVARAVEIPAGTTLASRWLLRNEEVIRYDFTPDFDIERACIWFFISPDEVRFSPGPWAVLLQINGQDAAAPITFTIQE